MPDTYLDDRNVYVISTNRNEAKLCMEPMLAGHATLRLYSEGQFGGIETCDIMAGLRQWIEKKEDIIA
jgi:hypothetical protein